MATSENKDQVGSEKFTAEEIRKTAENETTGKVIWGKRPETQSDVPAQFCGPGAPLLASS